MRRGDEGALKRLIPLVHRELHLIAQRRMAGERGGHSLQATVVVSNQAALRTFDLRPDGTYIVFDRSRQNSNIVLIDLPK